MRNAYVTKGLAGLRERKSVVEVLQRAENQRQYLAWERHNEARHVCNERLESLKWFLKSEPTVLLYAQLVYNVYITKRGP